jgi:hypothetical protein
MQPEVADEMESDKIYCAECGAEEDGYFCRNCGTLLRGEALVLCPRCHGVVPEGEHCNRCGQNLGVIALNLLQLSMAGDDFWVTAAASASETPESDLAFLAPNESTVLEQGELPDWLEELSAEEAPVEVKERIYPALRPVESQRAPSGQNRFLAVVIVLMGILLVGLFALTVFLVVQGV